MAPPVWVRLITARINTNGAYEANGGRQEMVADQQADGAAHGAEVGSYVDDVRDGSPASDDRAAGEPDLRGIWQRIFETVAAPCEPPRLAALDSSHVKAHRCVSGGKGGPKFRRSSDRSVCRSSYEGARLRAVHRAATDLNTCIVRSKSTDRLCGKAPAVGRMMRLDLGPLLSLKQNERDSTDWPPVRLTNVLNQNLV